MAQLSNGFARATGAIRVGALLERGARRLRRARVHFGHGTDNARDESAFLLWHVLRLDWPVTPAALARHVPLAQRREFERLVARRIETREPAAYLTGRTWFAGVPIRVDRRALVPRSPLAELIERRFAPWIDPARIGTILDLGTGSGCIAIACATWLPRARVDASDVSEPALALARDNAMRARRLQGRVRLVVADHYEGLGRRRYDIVVSNPPYVGARELRGLPAEYRHEPQGALAAGADGLASVRAILAGARAHLRPRGLLVVEVGNSERAVRRAWPGWPLTWLQFERGGGGVFALTREQIPSGGS